MDRILLIVGRVENNLSVRDSCFGHRTLQAITVGSGQMVAYTCIRTWGVLEGSNSCYYHSLPQDKPWDTGQSKDNPSSRHHVYTTGYYYSTTMSVDP
jgi:hypothetical protein